MSTDRTKASEAERKNPSKYVIKRTHLIPCDGNFRETSLGISPNNLQIFGRSVGALASVRTAAQEPMQSGEPKKIKVDGKLFRLNNGKLFPNNNMGGVFSQRNLFARASALNTVPDKTLRRGQLSVQPSVKIMADSSSQTDVENIRSVSVQTDSFFDCKCKLIGLDKELKKLKRKRILKKKHNLKVPYVQPSTKFNEGKESINRNRGNVQQLQDKVDTASPPLNTSPFPIPNSALSQVPCSASSPATSSAQSQASDPAPSLAPSTAPSLSVMLAPSIFQSVNCETVSKISNTSRLPSDVSLSEAVGLGDAVERYTANPEPLLPNEKLAHYFSLENFDVSLNKDSWLKTVKMACSQFKFDKMHCQQFENGYLPIHDSVLDDDVKEIERQCIVLIHMGLPLDQPDRTEDGKTPLLICISESKSYDCLDLLLKYKSHPLEKDSTSNNALHYAMQQEDLMYTTKILDYMRENSQSLLDYWRDVLRPTNSQVPEQPNILRTLLHAALSTYNDDGFTPLMVAALHGKNHQMLCVLEACKTSILDGGEDTVSDWLKSLVNMAGERDGRSALYVAVEYGMSKYDNLPDEYISCIKILLQHGADRSMRTSYSMSLSDLISTSSDKCRLLSIPDLVRNHSVIDEMEEEEFFEIAYEKVSNAPKSQKIPPAGPDAASQASISSDGTTNILPEYRGVRKRKKKRKDKNKKKVGSLVSAKKNKRGRAAMSAPTIKLEPIDYECYGTAENEASNAKTVVESFQHESGREPEQELPRKKAMQLKFTKGTRKVVLPSTGIGQDTTVSNQCVMITNALNGKRIVRVPFPNRLMLSNVEPHKSNNLNPEGN